jgi:hypothetical protein
MMKSLQMKKTRKTTLTTRTPACMRRLSLCSIHIPDAITTCKVGSPEEMNLGFEKQKFNMLIRLAIKSRMRNTERKLTDSHRNLQI